MKKRTTIVDQPDKTGAGKPELPPCQSFNPKMYRDHAHHDHTHGRVNKFPFGSSHGPWCF